MKISYVTNANPSVASYRYRISAPATLLKDRGHEVTVDAKASPEAETVCFSKHWTSNDVAYAQFCRLRGQKVVYDVCDDHFEDKFNDHYRNMIGQADTVTVNSSEMAKRVRAATGKEVFIIDDPVLSPLQAFRPGPPKMCWYGHIQNFQGLLDVYPPDCPVPLEIVVPGRIELPDSFNKPHITFSEWHPDSIQDVATRCNVALIPYRQDKPAKSANRILEAIQSGMFVMTDIIPAAQGIPGIWDLKKGLREGLMYFCENQPRILKSINMAQKYIQKYCVEKITNKWEKIL